MIRGRAKQVPGESAMWNSGVIGLRTSQRAILADTVDLIDTLFPICPIHTIEQVALSLILQDRQLSVRTCDAEVLHYHTFKEFRGDLARFFEHYQGAGTERLLQGWADIDPSLRIVPKRLFTAVPYWRLMVGGLLGCGWKPLPLPW